MAEGFGGTATGAEVFELGPRPRVPKDVQMSFLLWLAAVAAGVAETIVGIITFDPAATEAISILGIRLVVTTVLIYTIAQMRLGKNWARITLAVLLGGIGTLSLVFDPVSWLIEDNSLRELIRNADLAFIVFASIRVVHLASVVAALVFMFRPPANNYFRAAAR
jgi:Na+/H+ antiporter NhaA